MTAASTTHADSVAHLPRVVRYRWLLLVGFLLLAGFAAWWGFSILHALAEADRLSAQGGDPRLMISQYLQEDLKSGTTKHLQYLEFLRSRHSIQATLLATFPAWCALIVGAVSVWFLRGQIRMLGNQIKMAALSNEKLSESNVIAGVSSLLDHIVATRSYLVDTGQNCRLHMVDEMLAHVELLIGSANESAQTSGTGGPEVSSGSGPTWARYAEYLRCIIQYQKSGGVGPDGCVHTKQLHPD